MAGLASYAHRAGVQNTQIVGDARMLYHAEREAEAALSRQLSEDGGEEPLEEVTARLVVVLGASLIALVLLIGIAWFVIA